MKTYLFFIGVALTLSGCAYMEGVKNQKNVVPIPAGQSPAAAPSSLNSGSINNTATVGAAKTISPATR